MDPNSDLETEVRPCTDSDVGITVIQPRALGLSLGLVKSLSTCDSRKEVSRCCLAASSARGGVGQGDLVLPALCIVSETLKIHLVLYCTVGAKCHYGF